MSDHLQIIQVFTSNFTAMKRFTVIVTILLLMLIAPAAFSQDVYTMNCLATADNCEIIPGVEGRWAYEFFGFDTLIINRTMNTCYNVKLAVDKDFNFRGRFIEENGVLLLVLSNLEELDPSRFLYAPAHSIMRIQLDGDTLRFYGLNHEWFNREIQDGKFKLDYFTNQGNIYISAPPESIREMLVKAENEPEMFVELSYGIRVE